MQRKEIRSYVIREGRMTDGQKRALDEQWARFGIDSSHGKLDFDSLFEVIQPVTVEIGFGMGDSLFEMASARPTTNFLGIEVHRPGVGHLLIKAAEADLANLKVMKKDSVEVLNHCVGNATVDCVQIFFPDPWHKKKHHKRRLINRDFVNLLADRLKPGGLFHVATDWPNYAEWINEAVLEVPELSPVPPPPRPVTKYERRGIRLEHEVRDLAWVRTV